MIIDKLQPYWTAEKRQQLQEIKDLQEKLLEDYYKAFARTTNKIEVVEADGKEKTRIIFSEEINDIIEKWEKAEADERKLKDEIEALYFSDRNTKLLFADIKEITQAITREDFKSDIAEKLSFIAELELSGAKSDDIRLFGLKQHTIENYENCYNFILSHCSLQIKGLGKDPEAILKAQTIIEKKVALWYVKPQPTHFPIPYSKPTDALAFISQKQASIDKISGDATIDRFSVQLRIEKFKSLKASLGVSTDKLLSTALAVFAQNNDFNKGSKTAHNRRVIIPLREYATMLGYDVEEHETSTPEEAEAEKKRAKHALDNARKKTKKDLDILYNLSFEWEEIIKGKIESFSSVRLLSAKGYKGGNIDITFTPEIADHLVSRGLITQYNTGMLKLDERKPNAYYIMRKLEEHYNMDVNQRNNRNDRISILTLLEVTDLASYEEVQQKDRGHWIDRIKEPLEESLDYLTQEHLLKDWEYTHSKGVPLTEEEASNITDYSTFSKLYLKFKPATKIDHTERQEKRKAEIEKRRKKRENSRKKKKR